MKNAAGVATTDGCSGYWNIPGTFVLRKAGSPNIQASVFSITGKSELVKRAEALVLEGVGPTPSVRWILDLLDT